MVFVSYSHADREWFSRFSVMARPLERYADVVPWSDERIAPGKAWSTAIRSAIDDASVAVLLVSDNFLASDFIANEELPYILDASRSRGLQILWIALTPCYYSLTPLRSIQSVSDPPKPLNGMDEYGYKGALCQLCKRIDDLVKVAEKPVINKELEGKKLQREQRSLQVLSKPAKRETELLLFCGDGKWHTQSRVTKGSMTARCWIGDDKHTKSGSKFTITAITRQQRLAPGSSYLNIPDYRTKSEDVTIVRE